MMEILGEMEGVICLIDDIIVHGSTECEHDQRLKRVLNKIVQAGLTLNEAKCIFKTRTVKFLGHILDQDGIHIDPDKTDKNFKNLPLAK